jgi:hypothetical protein
MKDKNLKKVETLDTLDVVIEMLDGIKREASIPENEWSRSGIKGIIYEINLLSDGIKDGDLLPILSKSTPSPLPSPGIPRGEGNLSTGVNSYSRDRETIKGLVEAAKDGLDFILGYYQDETEKFRESLGNVIRIRAALSLATPSPAKVESSEPQRLSGDSLPGGR